MAPKRQLADGLVVEPSVPERQKSEEAVSTAFVVPKEKMKRDLLYEKCKESRAFGYDFTIDELMSFGVADTTDELTNYTQELVDRQLFCLLQQQNQAFLYRLRTKDVANSLLKMSVETRMIYGHVEGAGRQGTWKRSLTLKTNLHENTVGKSLKDLISRKLVKEIKSAKHPTRRIYMLSYMQPSDENSGGNFFNEGVLDGGLILNVGLVIVAYLDSRAWAEQPGHPKKDREYKSQVSKKRRLDDKTAVTNGAAIVDRPLFKTPENWKTGNVLVAHPADYKNYPSVADIQAHVAEVEVVKDITLGEDDIQRLLGKLELDGQVERMRGEDGKLTDTYRSVRNSWSSRTGPENWYGPQDPDSNGWGPGNGLTQTPCGRCPVFKECRPGGVVSPQTCVYLDDWLQF